MGETVLNQAYIFGIFVLVGLLIGILFDVFRILRKSFKTPDIITYLQDILFWLLTGSFILFAIFKFNSGELRAYLFFGIAIGIILYILIFSKIFIYVNVTIINWIKNILHIILNIFIFPLKILRKILLKPISFIFINFRRKITTIFKKMSKFKFKIKNKPKNHNLKKDFI